MSQSTLTVTPPSPTPPTNLSCTGATGPNPPNYTKLTYAGMEADPPTNPPPFFDDGVPAFAVDGTFSSWNEVSKTPTLAASRLTFAANTAALASGTGVTSGGTEGTYPGTDTPPMDTPNAVGPVPASTSAPHEAAGTETSAVAGTAWPQSAAVYNPTGPLTVVGVGPAQTAATLAAGPNASHASSLSPATAPTLSSITPGSTVSGAGTTTLAATGVGFTKQSVVYVNGVAQLTTFVSSTSLTCAAVTKKATAGPWPVTVVTGGVITTTAQTWTFT